MNFLAALILTAALVVDAEDLHCDPDTQFEQGGECCKMCSPGQKMQSSLESCSEPRCQPCRENEYQDKYTKDNTCKLQPYCDPNKNFKEAVAMKTTVKHVCSCKDGFHCSSQECITCVAHTPCGVGFGVQAKGSHMSDTVCEECRHGTFSNESSAEDACWTWTECGSGFYVEKAGTNRSDNICAKDRGHVIAIVIGVLCAAVAVVVVLGCLYKRTSSEGRSGDMFEVSVIQKCLSALCVLFVGRSGSMKKSARSSVESLGPESFTPIRQEETRTPVETEDIGITENGNCVVQEHGNAVKLSRQESQMDTTTEHSTFFSSSSEGKSSCERLNSL
uniref:CD40 molecule, TNF receptor superfamily member 5 n=1 Tax=Oryzias sinensis TaxID=183150 RepID=A0A8C7ZHQ8_9TELE